MVQTFSDENNIYSVDMMFAYINIFKPKYKNLKVNDLLYTLEFKGWGDPSKNIFYSAFDVLAKPDKYSDEIKRIKNADLKYPIIIANGFVVDGVHRLTKAYLNKNETIRAYIFNKNEMKKYLIDDKGDWKKVDKMQTYDFIIKFYKNFCK